MSKMQAGETATLAVLSESVCTTRRSKLQRNLYPRLPRLGELVRFWRQERDKSELDLSLDTGISQRHLSFVESGRSASGGNFLSIVSDPLNIPLRERNVLLLASGFAPQFSEQHIDAEQMATVTRAI